MDIIFDLCEMGTDHYFEADGENQDCVLTASLDDCILFAMADGFGSRAKAAPGSRMTCESAFETLRRSVITGEQFDSSSRVAVRAAFQTALNELMSRPDSDDLLCTLMVGSIHKQSGRIHYGYVGDGLLAALLSNGRVSVLEHPQRGELAHETFSILRPDCWRFGSASDCESLLVATDGIGDALEEGKTQLRKSDSVLDTRFILEAAAGGMRKNDFDELFPSACKEWRRSPFSRVFDDRTLLVIGSELDNENR